MSDVAAWAMALSSAVLSIVGWMIARELWTVRKRDLFTPLEPILADSWAKAPPGSGAEDCWEGTTEKGGKIAKCILTVRFEEIDR